jgi:hypothetical protein
LGYELEHHEGSEMTKLSTIVAVLLATECGGGFPSTGTTDAGGSDATTMCDTTKPFNAPTLVAFSDPSSQDYMPFLSRDELTMFFSSTRGDSTDVAHIYSTTRSNLQSAFGVATLVAGVDDVATIDQSDSALSADGLTMYFRGGDQTIGSLYQATRGSLLETFGAATLIPNVNSPPQFDNGDPAIDADGSLWLESTRDGVGISIYHAAYDNGSFDTPVAEHELSSAGNDFAPTLSADGLTIFFASDRRANSDDDIYVASRTSTTDTFSTPQSVTELDTSDDEVPHWLSADGCRLYFSRTTTTTSIYVASRPQ